MVVTTLTLVLLVPAVTTTGRLHGVLFTTANKDDDVLSEDCEILVLGVTRLGMFTGSDDDDMSPLLFLTSSRMYV